MRDGTAHEWGTQGVVSLWVGHPPISTRLQSNNQHDLQFLNRSVRNPDRLELRRSQSGNNRVHFGYVSRLRSKPYLDSSKLRRVYIEALTPVTICDSVDHLPYVAGKFARLASHPDGTNLDMTPMPLYSLSKFLFVHSREITVSIYIGGDRCAVISAYLNSTGGVRHFLMHFVVRAPFPSEKRLSSIIRD